MIKQYIVEYEENRIPVVSGLVQWDAGQILSIKGMKLNEETFKEIHFSLQDDETKVERVDAVYENGVLSARIPNYIFEKEQCYCAGSFYKGYAYVYLFNEAYQKTIYKICLEVESKPKSNNYISPKDIGTLEQLKIMVQQLEEDMQNKLNKEGYEPNKLLGTDEQGNVITKENNIEADSELSLESENPVMNKVVTLSIKELTEIVNFALGLAKGATKAVVCNTYEDMVTELNLLDKTKLSVNFHVMIREVCVPDLWVSDISDEHVEYTYTSNEDFIVDLTEDGVVQVGYFVLSALETQKVDLSEYVKNDDYAQPTVGGTVKVFGGQHGLNNPNGILTIMGASQSEIDAKEHMYKPITPIYLDYAVKKALSDCKLTGDDVWTKEEKVAVANLLGFTEPIPNGLVQRYSSGNICIPKIPTADVHATSKKYVDDLVGSVQSILTELHTHAESLIGGDA